MILQMLVNQKEVALEIAPDDILADVLRDRLGLLGTKIACREGECGACTILLDGKAVNSCLIPALKASNQEIITIEGLGNTKSPHIIQQRMADYGAVQCGFCTPGFVMSIADLLKETPHPSRVEIVEALAGNLCRCTGYVKIIEAVESLANEPLRE
ncbi:MAG: (2Fe-2S)-binding protein [Chloroflexi bacterium]|nr:(2Fe-2S)-binding protein [Chloroflexota bacterium]